MDTRIGKKFLHPGPGFGGSCFPKDTQALLSIGGENDIDLKVIRAAVEVNERQRTLMLAKITAASGGDVRGLTIGMLGLSFKPNTSDVRESPALDIAGDLLRAGARVRAFDPAAMDEARHFLPELMLARDEYEVAEGSDLLVLATEWNQFRQIDLGRVRSLLRRPVLVDLRNVYDPREMRRLGFQYTGVGR
jgi:UDPglucose 6-dehydrogenase